MLYILMTTEMHASFFFLKLCQERDILIEMYILRLSRASIKHFVSLLPCIRVVA